MEQLKVTFFGAAAIEVEDSRGAKVLVDPYITDNGFTARKVEDFYDVDLILVTHAAFDHLGDTLQIMKNSDAQLIAGFDICTLCQDAGIPLERTWMTVYGDKREYRGFTIRTVDARHISIQLQGDRVVTGVPFGYVITSDKGISVYHPGDTSLFSDMKLIRELYSPHIMLVGVDRISDPHPCEMTPGEAAMATRWIGPDVVIPAHYAPDSLAPSEFEALLKSYSPKTEVVGEVDKPFIYTKYRLERG